MCTLAHSESTQSLSGKSATLIKEAEVYQDRRSVVVKVSGQESITDNNVNESLRDRDVILLDSLVSEQKKQIQYMQEKLEKLENSSGLNFAVWTGIVLASVAVILTALGIVMALFSFVGYKKMINSAKDAAERISTDKASEVTEKLAPVVTESVLLKLLDKGNFDAIIFEAVQKVTYRGIEFSFGDMLNDDRSEGE